MPGRERERVRERERERAREREREPCHFGSSHPPRPRLGGGTRQRPRDTTVPEMPPGALAWQAHAVRSGLCLPQLDSPQRGRCPRLPTTTQSSHRTGDHAPHRKRPTRDPKQTQRALLPERPRSQRDQPSRASRTSAATPRRKPRPNRYRKARN